MGFREGTPPKTNNPKKWRWMVQFQAVRFRLQYHTEHPSTQRLLLVEAEFARVFDKQMKMSCFGHALRINFLPCCEAGVV